MSADTDLQIPNRYHFVWFGRSFPATNRVAIESCLSCCHGAEVVLWHSDDLSPREDFRALTRSGLITKRLDAELAFGPEDDATSPFDVPKLKRIWRALESPVARSNLARAILLYRFGGIYLDTDVLVLRNLDPHRRHTAFVGSERIVWPGWACSGLSFQRLVKSPLLGLLRKLSASVPRGDGLFRRTAGWYPKAVNGAVLGARAGHPFLAALLRETSQVPEAEWPIKHRLGTHVLQRTVQTYAGGDLTILPPDVFYPLGPEVSRQYFRLRSNPKRGADRILGSDTCAVHWYASVTDTTELSAAQLTEMAPKTIYGHLCAPYLSNSAAE